MKQLVLIICLLAGIGKTIAQCDMDVYKELMAAGDLFVAQKKYKEALNKYNAARLFCENKTKETDVYIARLYDQINQEKINAENNYRKAHLFSQYIDFKNNRSAWIYSDGYFAVIDSNGNLKTGFIYENPQPFADNIAIGRLNNNFVFVNDQGKIISDRFEFVIPICCNQYFAHERPQDFSSPYVPSYFILNKYGKKIATLNSNEINNISWSISNIINPIYSVDKEKSLQAVGLMDTTGKIKIPPVYRTLDFRYPYFYFTRYNANDFYINQYAAIPDGLTNHNYGVLDQFGNLLFSDTLFSYISEIEDGACLVKKNDELGTYNLNGGYRKLNYNLIKSLNDPLGDFNYVLTPPYVAVKSEIRKQKLEKSVDIYTPIPEKTEESEKKRPGKRNAKPKTNPDKTEPVKVSQDEWIETTKFLYKLINTKGEAIGPDIWYDSIKYYQSGKQAEDAFCIVKKDSLFGLISAKGAPIAPLRYTYISFMTQESMIFSKGNKWGLLNSKGTEIVKAEFDNITYEVEFYFGIKQKDTFLISHNGDIIPVNSNLAKLASIRNVIGAPHLSLCVTKSNEYILYYQNKMVSNVIYNDFRFLREGYCVLGKNGISTLFNSKGVAVKLKPYNDYYTFYNGYSIITIGEHIGLIKKINAETIKEIIPPEYEGINHIEFGQIEAHKMVDGEKWTDIYDTTGNLVFSIKQSKILKSTPAYRLIQSNYQEHLLDKNGLLQEVFQSPNVNFKVSNYRLVQDVNSGMYNYLRPDGSAICKIPFYNGTQMEEGYGFINRGDYNAIVDSLGNEYSDSILRGLATPVEQMAGFSQGRIPIFHNILGRGYLYTNGKFEVPDSVTDINYFSENYAFQRSVRNSLGCIQKLNGEIIPLDMEYMYADRFHDGNVRVLFSTSETTTSVVFNWGFVNFEGQKINNMDYEDAFDFSEGLAAVKHNGMWHYINTSGQIAFSGLFEEASSFKNNIAFVRKPNHKFLTFINKKGEEIFLPNRVTDVDFGIKEVLEAREYLEDSDHLRSPAPVSTGTPMYIVQNDSNLWGLMNQKGEIVIPCMYNKIWAEKTNVWLLEKDGRFGLYDINHKIKILNPLYSEFGKEMNTPNLIRVRKNGYWGWVDNQGKTVIPFRYSMAMPMENGRAWVKQAPMGELFQINTKGEMLLNTITQISEE